MSKHTPGPWSLHTSTKDWQMPYQVEDADGLCVVALDHHPVRDNAANARLIAAAPDLLEALEAAVECGMVPKSSACEGGANAYARQAHVADMIRAAIAKATGGSHA